MNSELETAIIEVNPETPVEQIAELYTKVEGMMKDASLLLDALKLKMIEKLKTTGEKAIAWKVSDDGEKRFWIGSTKSVKCRNPQKAFETLMQFDVNDALGCLSSNAWKHGAVKKLLDKEGSTELYDELFETVYKDKLETDKPTAELQSIDTRFLR